MQPSQLRTTPELQVSETSSSELSTFTHRTTFAIYIGYSVYGNADYFGKTAQQLYSKLTRLFTQHLRTAT